MNHKLLKAARAVHQAWQRFRYGAPDHEHEGVRWDWKACQEAHDALRTAVEEAEREAKPEPVAWLARAGDGGVRGGPWLTKEDAESVIPKSLGYEIFPVYRSPPAPLAAGQAEEMRLGEELTLLRELEAHARELRGDIYSGRADGSQEDYDGFRLTLAALDAHRAKEEKCE